MVVWRLSPRPCGSRTQIPSSREHRRDVAILRPSTQTHLERRRCRPRRRRETPAADQVGRGKPHSTAASPSRKRRKVPRPVHSAIESSCATRRPETDRRTGRPRCCAAPDTAGARRLESARRCRMHRTHMASPCTRSSPERGGDRRSARTAGGRPDGLHGQAARVACHAAGTFRLEAAEVEEPAPAAACPDAIRRRCQAAFGQVPGTQHCSQRRGRCAHRRTIQEPGRASAGRSACLASRRAGNVYATDLPTSPGIGVPTRVRNADKPAVIDPRLENVELACTPIDREQRRK